MSVYTNESKHVEPQVSRESALRFNPDANIKARHDNIMRWDTELAMKVIYILVIKQKDMLLGECQVFYNAWNDDRSHHRSPNTMKLLCFHTMVLHVLYHKLKFGIQSNEPPKVVAIRRSEK